MWRKWKRPAAVLLALLLVLWTVGCGAAVSETASSAAGQPEAFAEQPEVKTGAQETPENEAQTETEAAEPEKTQPAQTGEEKEASGETELSQDGSYTSKEEVALYLHTYGRLPGNYISKKSAEKLGWDSKNGNLWDIAPGMSIGGSRFGNYEGLLPEEDGRKYYECDIDYDGGYRGAKRLVYSDDGLIFYTEDHYKTFEQLY